ncbi:MAG: restriction endonuclease subunit S [Anaerolineales bacterium]|nr:restriction endonuclease subunit S [Anaerolineales bacterium]
MMIWPTTTFGSLYEEPSRNGIYKSKEFHGTGTRMVNMGELFAFPFISNQEMKRLTLTDVELDKFQLQKGDLLFARRSLIESGAGKCVLVETHDEPMVFESSIIRVRLQQKQCDPRFYYYYFLSPVGRGRIRAIVTGAAQKGIRGSELQNIEVHSPKIEIQERIADILSAYDDLIDNNNQRIALLEEAIHRLYREWFVHLRFPGHEHTAVVAGVPVGWEKRPLSDLVSTQYGYTESAQDEPVGPKYLRGTDINKTSYIDWSTVPYCPIDDDVLPKFKLDKYDILMIRMADPGKVGIVEKEIEAVFASYLVRLKPTSDELTPYYLFYFLSSHEYQGFITGASTGATRKSASATLMTSVNIMVPSHTIQQSFADYVVPMRQQITNLLNQNEKLREARDALLPRLMNGSLPV